MLTVGSNPTLSASIKAKSPEEIQGFSLFQGCRCWPDPAPAYRRDPEHGWRGLAMRRNDPPDSRLIASLGCRRQSGRARLRRVATAWSSPSVCPRPEQRGTPRGIAPRTPDLSAPRQSSLFFPHAARNVLEPGAGRPASAGRRSRPARGGACGSAIVPVGGDVAKAEALDRSGPAARRHSRNLPRRPAQPSGRSTRTAVTLYSGACTWPSRSGDVSRFTHRSAQWKLVNSSPGLIRSLRRIGSTALP